MNKLITNQLEESHQIIHWKVYQQRILYWLSNFSSEVQLSHCMPDTKTIMMLIFAYEPCLH
jgi:hypothetical protein